jgi:hypothetical protein
MRVESGHVAPHDGGRVAFRIDGDEHDARARAFARRQLAVRAPERAHRERTFVGTVRVAEEEILERRARRRGRARGGPSPPVRVKSAAGFGGSSGVPAIRNVTSAPLCPSVFAPKIAVAMQEQDACRDGDRARSPRSRVLRRGRGMTSWSHGMRGHVGGPGCARVASAEFSWARAPASARRCGTQARRRRPPTHSIPESSKAGANTNRRQRANAIRRAKASDARTQLVRCRNPTDKRAATFFERRRLCVARRTVGGTVAIQSRP